MGNDHQICLPYELLRLHGTPLEGFFFTWVFPWLFLLGLVGNSLNLLVLLRPRRPFRRADTLLVALALCDLLFLLLLVPSALAQFDLFSQHAQFRIFYLSLRVHLIAFANWCSAVAIWLIIAISADRLFGIRSLRHPSSGSPSRAGHLVCCIVVLSGLLTSYNHFSYHCVLKWLCNGGQVVGKCFDVLQDSWPGNHANLTPHHLRAYVRWSILANALLVVLLPILLMFLLNAALLLAVRRRTFPLPQHISRPFAQADHRVTVSVAAIVSAFTLTQGPSALVLLVRLALDREPKELWPGWETLSSLTAFLVVLGKALNCVLLCLSSASFRRRLALTVRPKRSSSAGSNPGPLGSGRRRFNSLP